MKKSALSSFVHFIVFSHLFLAGVVTAFYLGNNLLLNNELKIDSYAFFVFSASLLLYNVHRIYGLNNQRGILPLRYQWAAKNLRLVYVLIIISLLATSYLSLTSIKPHSFLLLLGIAGISLSYTFPLVPTANELIRLKDIPLVKPVFISLVVVIVTLVLPQLNKSGSFDFITSYFVLLCSAQFLLTAALTYLFDIRDIESDKENNVKTLPVVYGPKTTKAVSYMCIGLYLAMVFLLTKNSTLSVMNLFALIGTAGLTILTIYFSNKRTHPIYYMLVADGIMAVQFILLLICHYFIIP